MTATQPNFTKEFQERYGAAMLDIAQLIGRMAREGDEEAIHQTIKALSLILAGARAAIKVNQASKAFLN